MLALRLTLSIMLMASANLGAQVAMDETPQSARANCKELFLSKGKDEVSCFVNSIRVARLFCEVDFQKAQLTGEYAEFRACLTRGERSMKIYFDLARPKVAKKRAADDALKDLYAYALSGLRGMDPEVSERKIDYERRQTERKQGIEDRISRLEIER